MFLVTGGFAGSDWWMDTTEIFDPDHESWRSGAALPSPRTYLRATTIDNRVLVFGINITINKCIF